MVPSVPSVALFRAATRAAAGSCAAGSGACCCCEAWIRASGAALSARAPNAAAAKNLRCVIESVSSAHMLRQATERARNVSIFGLSGRREPEAAPARWPGAAALMIYFVGDEDAARISGYIFLHRAG